MRWPFSHHLQVADFVEPDYRTMLDNYLIDGPVTTEIISSFMGKESHKTDSGGHSIFLGQVRADEVNGKRVKAIEYSAYENMVNAEADKIKESVFSEYDDVKSIYIIHSKGVVQTGEVSLAVMVSAGHRLHAMKACSKAVELIKERLPVWKKEIYEDNSYYWRENE
jgi:molybdopterin synthase catalytic subunit